MTQLLSSFRSIRFSLIVGIGGGIPSSKADIRLGDIVVSQPADTSGGVIQYDLGKVLNGGQFQRIGMLNRPPNFLLTALATIKAHHFIDDSRVLEFISNVRAKTTPWIAAKFARPTEKDFLYQSDYSHGVSDTCIDCDRSKLTPRPSRDHEEPVIHYGLIASANQVVKDGRWRDQLAQDLGVYCVEMEAAGLMTDFPCLVIRGICDYADSHKNKEWQGYAAAVAAAYAKELLSLVPIDQITNIPPARDSLTDVQGDIEAWLKDSQGCLRSLAFPQMWDRSNNIDDAIKGTCGWLLGHEMYQRWAACDRGILWIKGNAGSGKSTLLKYALDNGEARDSTLVLSFFFSGRGSALQRTPLGLFRSLLHQILGQAPDILMDLVGTFQKRCVEIGNAGEEWQWHPKELWRFFESCLPKLLETRSVWLFVDALDECGAEGAASLVENFDFLLKSLPPRSTGLDQFLICFTCRPYPILDVKSTFKIWLERENGRDISTFVNERLSPLGELSSTLPALIPFRAKGNFGWACLVVKKFLEFYHEGYNREQIEAEIVSAFPDLDGSHTEFIQTMNRGSPGSEKPTEDYQPSATAIIATESSVLSQGLWSSEDARVTVNASTTGTSVDPGGQQMDQELADHASIYTSDVPKSLAYVQELASSFFKGSEYPDAQSLERIRESLPDLLRGFAQRIGGENHASVHYEVMKFIYKKRG